MNTSIPAAYFSALEPKWPRLARFLHRPTLRWAWTYRILLLKALFSLAVFLWSLPDAIRAVLSPHFAKCTFLLLLFTLFVVRRSFTLNAKPFFAPKEPPQ